MQVVFAALFACEMAEGAENSPEQAVNAEDTLKVSAGCI
jgi:hypothetical protein